MKVRLNKKTLADMPEEIRAKVTEWQTQYRKAFINVVTAPFFYPDENARVEMVNLVSGDRKEAQAAGEFAGHTKLSPVDKIPLPEGCLAVVTGFFLGTPYLYIYQGGKTAIAE